MKRFLSLLLAVLMVSSLAACGDQATDGESGTTDASIQDVSSSETVTKKEIIWGNNPNNLLQTSDALCFGEDRVFYMSSACTLCSFRMDGSDWQEHYVVSDDKWSMPTLCLNYYNGGIYFTSENEVSDTVTTLEICRYDITKGTVETIHTFAHESARAFPENMIIFNDTLCCAYYVSDTKRVCVEAIDLTTGKSNLIAQGASSIGGTSAFGFDTDGTYLYMIWNGGINEACIRRVLLSALYDEEPTVEQMLKRPYYRNSYILEDGGLYAAALDKDENGTYGFYSHETLAGSTREVTLKEIAQISYRTYPETEEERLGNLGFGYYSNGYILDGARVCVETNNKNLRLFYAKGLDWRESVCVAEPSHGMTNPTKHYHMGEYNETLYIVLEDDDGNASLHFMTADGNYQ